MSQTVNFTAEHKTELEQLFLKLSFKGQTLVGKFGANTLTAYDLLHNTSLGTLKSLHNQLKNELSKAESEEDDWTVSSHEQRQIKLKKDWKQLIHLLIGFKRAQAEKAANASAVREMKAQLAELKQSTKTPEEKIKELEESISKMDSSEDPDSEE